MDVAKLVAQYVKLRDVIKEKEKEFDTAIKPYKDAKIELEGIFNQALLDSNTLSMRTEGGTISATIRSSATVQDMDAFRNFVINGNWDLADLRANAPLVREFADTHKQLPPGVKFSEIRTISVRRPSES